ncbi:putative Histone-lysine N-methyltransferase, H3 lysine-9 specific [Balamuthia mandrillaris]
MSSKLFKHAENGNVEKLMEEVSSLPREELNVKGELGWTALHWAAFGGQKECLILLLAHGASIDAKATGLETPLHLAANGGHFSCVSELLERGATADPKDNHQQTPLHWASYWGKLEVAELLLKAGCDPDVKDDRGKRPLDLAAASVKGLLSEVTKPSSSPPAPASSAPSSARGEARENGREIPLILRSECDGNMDDGGNSVLSSAAALPSPRNQVYSSAPSSSSHSTLSPSTSSTTLSSPTAPSSSGSTSSNGSRTPTDVPSVADSERDLNTTGEQRRRTGSKRSSSKSTPTSSDKTRRHSGISSSRDRRESAEDKGSTPPQREKDLDLFSAKKESGIEQGDSASRGNASPLVSPKPLPTLPSASPGRPNTPPGSAGGTFGRKASQGFVRPARPPPNPNETIPPRPPRPANTSSPVGSGIEEGGGVGAGAPSPSSSNSPSPRRNPPLPPSLRGGAGGNEPAQRLPQRPPVTLSGGSVGRLEGKGVAQEAARREVLDRARKVLEQGQ